MKVLVIVADALHLGYLGCYGNDWIETPALDELAATGVVFDQHLSDRPDPAGARHAWRTGRFAFPLLDAVPPSSPGADLLDLLKRHGVATSLVIDGSRSHVADFAAGWKRVKLVAPDEEGTPLEQTLEAAVAELERQTKRDNWLVWVELAALWPPWELPDSFLGRYFQDEEEEDETAEGTEPLSPLTDPPPGLVNPADDVTFLRLQRTYAGAVSYLDAGLGLLFEELDRSGLTEEVLVLLTSDHGLPLGEHGVIGLARPWLHDELIHVPLMVRFPGAVEAGRRVSALTQAVDVCPTLLDAFGIPLPPMHGQSLLPLARGQAAPVREFACCGLQVGEALEWVLRTPERGLLLPLRQVADDPPRLVQLYVKPDDRWEVNELRQQHLEEAEELEQQLRDFVARTCPAS